MTTQDEIHMTTYKKCTICSFTEITHKIVNNDFFMYGCTLCKNKCIVCVHMSGKPKKGKSDYFKNLCIIRPELLKNVVYSNLNKN